ncbi:dTMP kinase [Desulfatitalea tepidiphila]|uniref:dTMP kinase n=1 Tax=Desulfatitalea tepidiphila TaxID=1185843 RepID=UPI0006B5FBE3|nr:dTMP kinase [Desulfatitalea tepidiphila]
MFITLEGIEGSGKSTQLENIVAFLRTRGYECVTSREPGGTPVGAQIRKVLLDPSNAGLDATAELLLYNADRVQHIRSVIQPHLAAGRVVVCDRFFDATMVYQGYARGVDKAMIRALHRLVCDDLQPDLTLLFDLDPHIGLGRAWREIDSGGRTQGESRFEQEKLAFHQAVRDGYLDMARLEPHRFRIIPADQDPQAVARCVEAQLAPVFPERP